MPHGALWIAMFMLAQAAAPVAPDSAAEVARLVRQLDAPQLAQREAAESQLLKLGPGILEHLPSSDRRLPPEVQQRLGRIRQKLQQATAEDSTEATRITLHAPQMPLGQIFRAFQEQSGNKILFDERLRSEPSILDRPFRVDFQAEPFWPALDRLLDQAGLDVYPYAEEGGISVVARRENLQRDRHGRVGYDGPFRFEVVSIAAKRDWSRPGPGSLAVTLEAAWEPRLPVILLMQRMTEIHATDERGEPLPVADPAAQLEIPVNDKASAVQVSLPMQLPSRDVRRIAVLEGKLRATLPGRMEAFRFEKLGNAKDVEKRIANVTVVLEDVRKTSAGCEIRLRVRYDDAGDALASHRQWIFGNPASLQTADGKSIAYDSYETTAQSKNELGIAYRFVTDQAIEGMTLVYQTPGAIFTKTFQYEVKEMELP